MRYLPAVAALLWTSCAIAQPSPWPAAVRGAVAKATQVCREAGGRPGRSPELVKTVDLTGDGIADYLVDWSQYDCVGAASAMANGQDGSAIEVLVGLRGNAAVSAYGNSVYGAKVETAGGRNRLWIDLAAMDCGQNARGVPFANWQFCSRELVWSPATRKFALAPMAQKRRI
ncbi:hypothetical protein M9980_02815 [Sphingomonas donggukensis]|uniref:Uncharacterized protein n=1 Tax=Sphingomonas donggukensis TaxID=2949093 RepID=A0ABY4TWC6_9SPHN|nr:hypothetical protein [Sphingomonas donggukensis]URW76180.1 hypothetical protein M9980_02815 [Sphingomonas donggukensis]